MKKVIIIPDSFKGSLTSSQVADVISEAVLKYEPYCQAVRIPVADGGEGTVDCFLDAIGGEKITMTVCGPLLDKTEASYGILPGNIAVIEMASCAGLPLVGTRANPSKTSTYGVGEMMLDATKRGCREIILGLGGSATNDCGCGAAVAAGIRFYDHEGNSFLPTGATLVRIDRIQTEEMNPALRNASIEVMCDVENPLSGKNGAAYVYAPQKGADAEMVSQLDEGLCVCGRLFHQMTGKNIAEMPGAGAAGGMGSGMVAFFDAALASGIETVLHMVHAKELFCGADLIVTGEGRFDSQSLQGKVISGILKFADGIPVIVIAGDCDISLQSAYDAGITAVFPCNPLAQDFSVSRIYCRENLAYTADNIFRLMHTFS